jgi:hypothetical protein
MVSFEYIFHASGASKFTLSNPVCFCTLLPSQLLNDSSSSGTAMDMSSILMNPMEDDDLQSSPKGDGNAVTDIQESVANEQLKADCDNNDSVDLEAGRVYLEEAVEKKLPADMGVVSLSPKGNDQFVTGRDGADKEDSYGSPIDKHNNLGPQEEDDPAVLARRSSVHKWHVLGKAALASVAFSGLAAKAAEKALGDEDDDPTGGNVDGSQLHTDPGTSHVTTTQPSAPHVDVFQTQYSWYVFGFWFFPDLAGHSFDSWSL